MSCGHVFHLPCITALLSHKWNGPRITFGFCRCPICSTPWINTSSANKEVTACLEPLNKLYEEVRRKSLLRLSYDGVQVPDDMDEDAKAALAMGKVRLVLSILSFLSLTLGVPLVCILPLLSMWQRLPWRRSGV